MEFWTGKQERRPVYRLLVLVTESNLLSTNSFVRSIVYYFSSLSVSETGFLLYYMLDMLL